MDWISKGFFNGIIYPKILSFLVSSFSHIIKFPHRLCSKWIWSLYASSSRIPIFVLQIWLHFSLFFLYWIFFPFLSFGELQILKIIQCYHRSKNLDLPSMVDSIQASPFSKDSGKYPLFLYSITLTSPNRLLNFYPLEFSNKGRWANTGGSSSNIL